MTVRLGVVVVSLVIAAAVTDRGLNALDEGALLHTAERILDGEVLYRDVATGLTPGSYLLQAALFGLFGTGLGIGRLLMVVLMALSTYWICRILERWTSIGVAVAFSFGFLAWQVVHWRFLGYTPEAITLVIASVYQFTRYLEDRSERRLVAACLLVGLAAVFKQNVGAYAAVALGGIVLFELLGSDEGRSDLRRGARRLVIVAVGFATPLLVVALYFVFLGAFRPFFESILLLPFSAQRDAFVLPYVPLWTDLAGAPEAVRTNLSHYSPLLRLNQWAQHRGVSEQTIFALSQTQYWLPPTVLAVAAGLYMTPAARRLGLAGAARTVRVTLLVCSVWLFLGVFPRADLHHLVLATPLVPVVAAFVGWDLLGRSRVLLAVVVGLPLLLWTGLNALVVGAWIHHPEPALRNTVRLGLERADVLVTENERRRVRMTTRTIESVTGEDEVAVLSPDSLYYFLTDKTNPFRFPLVLPGALDEAEIVSVLEDRKIPWVLFRGETFNDRRFSQDMGEIYAYLKEHYRAGQQSPVGGLPWDLSLLERLDGGDAASGSQPGVDEEVIDLIAELPRAEMLSASPWTEFRRGSTHINWVRPRSWLFRDAIQATAASGLAKTLVAFPLVLPAGAQFRFAVGIRPSDWELEGADGALFEVFVHDRRGDEVEGVFARFLDPAGSPDDRGWHDHRVDLADWGGRAVTLVLATSGGPRLNLRDGDGIRPWDGAGWAEPRIVYPGGDPVGKAATPREASGLEAHVVASLAEFADASLFTRFREDLPEDADIAFALGLVLFHQERYAEAAASLEEAWAGGIRFRGLAWALTESLHRLEEPGKLEQYLGLFRDAFPGETFPLARLASLRVRQGRNAEAVMLYEELLGRTPDDAAIHGHLARLHAATGRPGEAADHARAALATRPEDAGLLLLLAAVEFERGRFSEANEAFEGAWGLVPDGFSEGQYVRFGESLRRAGDLDRAREVWRTGLSRYPESVELGRRLEGPPAAPPPEAGEERS